MPHPLRRYRGVSGRVLLALAAAGLPPAALADPVAGAQPGPVPVAMTPATPARTDPKGNPLRRASTGHVSNYDESKVGNYILPDPLRSLAGEPIATRAAWMGLRRPELLEIYRREIYGRVPAGAPRVTYRISPAEAILGGSGTHRVVTATFGGEQPLAVVQVHLYASSRPKHPSPLLLHLLFSAPPSVTDLADQPDPPSIPGPAHRAVEAGPISALIAQGYIYAAFRYIELEPDSRTPATTGVRGPLQQGQPVGAAPDAWGAIAAWAWGTSRILDYLIALPEVDPARVALIGHSRLGKTVLWAAAQDERFQLIFSSCAGEMGSALARRDYGESVDDMAGNFEWQFSANFRKYLGHIDALPVDAHELIALQAPRPVLITGGTQDQWADPRGEFLAEVAAGPVYRLLGKQGLSSSDFPAPDAPVIGGELAYLYHTGPHAIIAQDWKTFLNWAGRYLAASQR